MIEMVGIKGGERTEKAKKVKEIKFTHHLPGSLHAYKCRNYQEKNRY